MISRKFTRVFLGCGVAMGALAMPAYGQDITSANAPAAEEKEAQIIVTGSRIKRDPNDSALPLTIITNDDIAKNGIANPEQLTMFLTSNGTGPDNLASNSDVVTGAQRGTNGLSAANLRGQGSAATLILLNGRRVAAHGLSGGAVDVNQIPFAAMERVEVLKDGASAIYGTDAIGGVINYITKKSYQGFGMQGSSDVTQHGGGNIYRLSAIVGFGDLNDQGINVMASVSYSWNQRLRGSQRDFVNGNQPLRGLAIDTRGTPIATIFNTGTSPYTPINPITGLHTATLTNGLTLLAPDGVTNAVGGGINTLDLPGGAGCNTMDGGMPYDEVLWAAPSAGYACAWDTGRAAALQQPIETLTYYGRGIISLGGGHEISAEITGSSAKSAKSFSNAQISSNVTSSTAKLPVAYPLNPLTQTTYDAIFNSLLAAFPGSAAALNANYGRPLGYRWRCIPCGPRQYNTSTNTLRAYLALEGPLPIEGWDYKVGASHAQSESSSLLGSGYYYRGSIGTTGAPDPMAPTAPGASSPGLVGLLNSGILNPFSLTQTAQALAGLEAVSANGTTLYGGRYTVKEIDASIAGPLFDLPGGKAQIAAGIDYRRETYSFNGSAADAAGQPVIFLAAFDNVNALTPKNRTVKAAYAELDLPIFDMLSVTGAFRIDDYSGFGTTTNPKVTAKFKPVDWLMFRGSYNTGFRVPSFNQIFNGRTENVTNTGANIADPLTCPTPTAPVSTNPGCALITPEYITGGNPILGPETAKQYSVGVVFKPSRDFSISVDWWKISAENTIQLFSFRQLLENYTLFPEKFTRDSSGALIEIDSTWANAGARSTQGLELAIRAATQALGGRLSAGLDGSYLLEKKERLTKTAPWSASQIGVFTFTGDLGLRWKHNAFVNWSNDDVSLTFSQIFRKGYKNGALPGSTAAPEYNAMVKDYVVYNLSAAYTGLAPGFKLTAGIKNLFDTDPPFAITYEGLSGAGGSWEPRVADPRGRSFTIAVEVKF